MRLIAVLIKAFRYFVYFKTILFLIFYIYIWVSPHELHTYGGQNRVPDPLKLEVHHRWLGATWQRYWELSLGLLQV